MKQKSLKKFSNFQNSRINPKGYHPSQLKFYVMLLPLIIIMLLPIIFIFSHAFKPLDELFAYPPRFFVINPTFKNFTDLFSKMSGSGIPVSRYLFNSIVITIVTVAASIVVSSTAAYALSKKKFKLKKVLFSINTVALMFVPIAVTIPRFLIIERLNLMDTFLVHVLPGLAMPVGLFLIKQFIDGIPDDVVEAARIDGASDWRIYYAIILPMIKPAIATIAILTFQATWNNAEISTMYINDESLKTFAFYLTTLTSTASGANAVAGQGISAAASLITFLPNLIIFILLQSQVMSTMSHSGLK
ncbi:MAG TPA: carbohydrate ABC transporter permease [Anaerolineaceae bacterium]|nr:carbohydrate ABC transporter permease [Longilinea sp.]NMD30876.1 carbohydrate ABC transporter permease [Chloroflexota bacterium]HNZ01262.1 carbohydrate ABC transporter permease [Anaerolineaceae bacterium]HOD44704.1 carbohydrate ABC transporter permease [Anaerolineaceae bacterium]HOH20476.1 carbohydrate ABC transporter permease [Anaerolineaceae bacterium]